MKYSKLISLFTAGYGAFALVKPRHLADNLEAPAGQAPAYDRMAYTYAGRDLAISGLALVARNPAVVTAAMTLRIASDLADASILGSATTSQPARTEEGPRHHPGLGSAERCRAAGRPPPAALTPMR